MDNSDFTKANFTSNLDYDVLIYDSFNPTHPTDAENNYLGELTGLGTLKAKGTMSILPIRVLSTFVLEKADTTEPLKRFIVSQNDEKPTDFSFSLAKSDQDAMTNTIKFIDFFLANPNDSLVTAFNALLKSGSKTLAKDVDAFFSSHADYVGATYMTYMMGLVYRAQHPAPPPPAPDPTNPAPPPERSYSLSTLVRLLGGDWPQGMEDITVKDLKIAFTDDALDISLELDFTTLTFENDEIAGNVKKMVTDTTIKAALTVNFTLGLNIFFTRLALHFDDFSIPVSASDKLTVTKPSVTIDINPLFKFVVFTLDGIIPVTINGTPLNLDVSLTVDNDEAAIDVEVEGNHASLPPPPGIKGLHFDSIGAGMGLFFKPPGLGLGIEGQFHIGDSTGGNVISLDDDRFAFVCEFVEEAVEPKFLAFYVPKLDLNTVVELFTNVNPKIDVPVEFSDLSFHWSDGLMDCVVLPDGSLSPGGYGFSAAAQIFSFGFFGQANLDINTGLTADIEVSPLNWKNVFKLTGDGKGYSMKYDQNGNPIQNNFVPTTQAEKDAVAAATSRAIVDPGGPVLIINTLSMPILHLNAKASLFDVANYDIQADINKSGITFLLDYGIVLKEKMTVTLADWHNLAASFTYYINQTITVPPVAGVHLGSFTLAADVSVHFAIVTSLSDVKLSVGGNFNFEGLGRSFGDFNADINISKITDFLIAIGKYIEEEAKNIFSDFLNDAQKCADKVKSGFITGADEVGTVLKDVWHADSIAVASIMKNAGYVIDDISRNIKNAWNCATTDVTYALKAVGYTADEIAVSLKNIFNAASQDVAAALKAMGFTADEVAAAIKNCWNCAINDVDWAMSYAGYAIDDIASGLKSAFSATAQDVAASLKAMGHAINDIGKALKDVYNVASQDMAAIFKNLGYAAADVAGAIKNTWNCAVNDVTWAMHYAGWAATDIANGLKSAFNAAAQDVANSFKAFGIAAQDTANAIKDVYNLTINDAASVLKQAGYAADDVASALKNAFNVSVDAVANAMKQVGYAADDVKNAFEALGGDFKNLADTAWGDTKHYLNPSNW